LSFEFPVGIPGDIPQPAVVVTSGVGFTDRLGWVRLSADHLRQVAMFLDVAALAEPGSAGHRVELPGAGLVFEVEEAEERSVTYRVDVFDLDGDVVGGLGMTTTRLELALEASMFRGDTDPGVPKSGFARYELFRPHHLGDSLPLLWRVAHPPEGSRLNQVRPAERGTEIPGGQVALVVGWVFADSVDAVIALDRLRYLTPGVVADLLGTLPDGRRFAVAVIQSDPGLDEAWALEESLQETRRGRAARRRAFYVPVLLDRMAAAQADVPEAWLAGTGLVDLHALDLQLYRREGYDWPADVGFDVGLQVLLAEVVGAKLTSVLAALQEGDHCLFRQPHDCELDVVADALAAWRDGTLRMNDTTMASGGSSVVVAPGDPTPVEIDMTPQSARSRRHREKAIDWDGPAITALSQALAAVEWGDDDEEGDLDTVEGILRGLDPLVWLPLMPERGFDIDGNAR
jgi:hypothetical protein